jgi:hypothetical protein
MPFLVPSYHPPPLFAALVITGCLSNGCNRTPETVTVPQQAIQTGGNYAPVKSADLIGSSSSQRTGGEPHDFIWSFADGTFVITGKKIPTDLVLALLGDVAKVKRIQGKWKITGQNLQLVVDTGNEAETKETSMPIMNTGVIRVTTPAAQYVFTKG